MGQITVISQFITAGLQSGPKLDKRGNGKDRRGVGANYYFVNFHSNSSSDLKQSVSF